ncbi:MAG: alpha/beta fold hydrolase [Pseudomonadales bacterium]|nr:alpha/beta fold hydrolase [Pseudomonadales bacterium]
MPQITANGIRIEYDTFGNPDDRPLLLVMGLGAQMTRWRPELCELLAADGHYVVRFDNRDVGLSQKFDAAGVPNMAEIFARAQSGQPVKAPYSLDDMADDAVGVLDALGIDHVHVCGVSMGGMIVQQMAVRHGQRLHSMTSIMSSTGNPDLPKSTPEATAALLSPAGTTLEDVLARSVSVARTIGSRVHLDDEAVIRARAREDFERCFYPVGVARQMAAIAVSGNRRPALGGIRTPTLVIHGKDDPLVPLAGGIDTHEAIPGSRLAVIEDMGHDLPEPLWPEIVRHISAHTAQHHPRGASR